MTGANKLTSFCVVIHVELGSSIVARMLAEKNSTDSEEG